MRLAGSSKLPLAAALGVVPWSALEAQRGNIDDVFGYPNFVTRLQREPVRALRGVFVFGHHEQLTTLHNIVAKRLHKAKARPLTQELHFHEHQNSVRPSFNPPKRRSAVAAGLLFGVREAWPLSEVVG